MLLRFSQTVRYERSPGVGPVFEAGQTYEIEDHIGVRWIRRNVAEAVDPPEEPAVTEPEAPPPEPDPEPEAPVEAEAEGPAEAEPEPTAEPESLEPKPRRGGRRRSA